MSSPTDRERAELEARKRASVAQLLFKAARLLDAKAVALVRDRTGMPIRQAHTSLFPHIELEGTRLTVLAQRMGISKQAVGQLVDELVEMGGLERVADPTDGRARLIRFAQRRGSLSLLDGLAVLEELEGELAEQLGQGAVDRLRKLLQQLLDVLEGSS